MLRFRLLRNLLILSLAMAILLPVYEFFFVHPAYKDLLAEETESEAVRYASYMVRALGLENQLLVKDRLPAGLGKSLQPASRDHRLIKLRIFTAQGEVIFSTKQEEIGILNSNDYFREIVAKGQVYSKVVRKDDKTADGDVAKIDIVETYVPFMASDKFGGAIEVYYDVSDSVSRVKTLTSHSMATTLFMSLGFLAAIFFALTRAQMSFLQRDAAEEALRLANGKLEARVAERTRELSDTNLKLTDQIVERARAQTALGMALEEIKADREKLEGILSSVPDGVVVTDGDLNVLHMNAAAEGILETPLEKALGHPVAILSKEVDFIKKIGQRLDLTYGPQFFDFELSGDSSNSRRAYQTRVSQFISDSSDSPGIVLLIRDVTKEREIEQMKSAFLGMAAHELNTPLTTIIGYTELLTAEETAGTFNEQQQKDFLLLVHNKALALGGLIDDLLDISRVESGRPLDLCRQDFLLSSMIREIVESYREECRCHQFEVALPDEVASLWADPSRLEQVVDHLIRNAVKYSPEGGRVRVTLTVHDGEYEISVEDEGIGMNEEQLAHIFDRFYRADSSDTAVQGVGLGMSIVRNIVLAHQGEIHVDSQPGSGTRVCITLPMTSSAGHDENNQPFAANSGGC
ncbi:MAG: ATP-binding protein [Desulfuromonadales bacterium]